MYTFSQRISHNISELEFLVFRDTGHLFTSAGGVSTSPPIRLLSELLETMVYVLSPLLGQANTQHSIIVFWACMAFFTVREYLRATSMGTSIRTSMEPQWGLSRTLLA